MKKYTVKQIKEYIEGFKIIKFNDDFAEEYNDAIINILHDIEDEQDGIDAYFKLRNGKSARSC